MKSSLLLQIKTKLFSLSKIHTSLIVWVFPVLVKLLSTYTNWIGNVWFLLACLSDYEWLKILLLLLSQKYNVWKKGRVCEESLCRIVNCHIYFEPHLSPESWFQEFLSECMLLSLGIVFVRSQSKCKNYFIFFFSCLCHRHFIWTF